MQANESEILRRLRLIEILKADVVSAAAQVIRSAADHGERAVADAIAGVIVSGYILGRRLGVDFPAVDDAVSARLAHAAKHPPDAEKWYGDHSELARHFRNKR